MISKMDVDFLYYLKVTLFLTGIFPFDMLTCPRKWYSLFRDISHATYLLLLSFLYMEVPYIWNQGNKLVESVNIIMTCTLLVLKMMVCRRGIFTSLISDMAATEKNMLASGDLSLFSIYKRYVERGKYIQLYNIYFNTTSGVVIAFTYFYKYVVVYHFMTYDASDERILLYHMWMPFDKTRNYVLAFAVNCLMMVVTLLYNFTVSGTLIVLLLFISFRLEVLGYLLKNIEVYASTIDENRTFHSDNGRVEAVLRFCVLEHLAIIKFANTLNSCMRGIILLEFVLLSAQIALILFEGFTNQSFNIVVLTVIHVIFLLGQMLLFYWHADDMKNKSVAISDALFESNWYNYNKSINRTIHIMMIRSQKPVAITVGPFGEMSLTMALKIIKGVYTYATFLEHSYGYPTNGKVN